MLGKITNFSMNTLHHDWSQKKMKIVNKNIKHNIDEARVKRRSSHEPNRIQMMKTLYSST